jgi:hypothetical protein
MWLSAGGREVGDCQATKALAPGLPASPRRPPTLNRAHLLGLVNCILLC